MAIDSEQELFLREYEQAGECCRNHDSLIRTGITIFGAAQAAILAVIVAQSKPNLCYTFVLELLGFWLSVVVLFTTFRLRRRYATYMKRAKHLEAQLGFTLYTSSQEEFESKWYLRLMPGNKTWLASLPALMAVLYLIFLFLHVGSFVEAIHCGTCLP
jgi:hypothetical protein